MTEPQRPAIRLVLPHEVTLGAEILDAGYLRRVTSSGRHGPYWEFMTRTSGNRFKRVRIRERRFIAMTATPPLAGDGDQEVPAR